MVGVPLGSTGSARLSQAPVRGSSTTMMIHASGSIDGDEDRPRVPIAEVVGHPRPIVAEVVNYQADRERCHLSAVPHRQVLVGDYIPAGATHVDPRRYRVGDTVMSRTILDMTVTWVRSRICHIREHYPYHPQWYGYHYTYGVVSYKSYQHDGVTNQTVGDLRWVGEEAIRPDQDWLTTSVSSEDRRLGEGTTTNVYDPTLDSEVGTESGVYWRLWEEGRLVGQNGRRRANVTLTPTQIQNQLRFQHRCGSFDPSVLSRGGHTALREEPEEAALTAGVATYDANVRRMIHSSDVSANANTPRMDVRGHNLMIVNPETERDLDLRRVRGT